MTRKPDDEYPLLLSVEQAAEYAGVGRDVIYCDLRNRINPLPHFRDGRCYRISRDHLSAYYSKKMIGI